MRRLRFEVLNIARELHRGATPGAIYIGRANKWNGRSGSPLRNPYRIGPDGSRARCIELYRDYLQKRIRYGDRSILDELARLASIAERTGRLTLVCFCAPLPCHADVIIDELQKVFSVEEVA